MNIKACPLCGAELITVEYHHNELIGTCRCGLDFRIKADKPTEIWNNRPVEDELKNMLNEELSKTVGVAHWIERWDTDSKWLECSGCHGAVDSRAATRYCPNCGSKME